MTSDAPYVIPSPPPYTPKGDFDGHLEPERCKDALLEIRKIHEHAVPYHTKSVCPCRTCRTLSVIEGVIQK